MRGVEPYVDEGERPTGFTRTRQSVKALCDIAEWLGYESPEQYGEMCNYDDGLPEAVTARLEAKLKELE